MIAGLSVHQHLRLDDRHDAGFLAKRGVAGERLGVLLDGAPGRQIVGDRDDAAPFGEAGAELVVFGEPLAQAVEAFGDGLAGMRRQRLGAGIDLDAGHGAGWP